MPSLFFQFGGVLGFVLFIPLVCAQTLVLNDATGAPYTTSGRDGFLDIVCSKLFKNAGVDLMLVRLPAERGLRNANEGINDGEIMRIKGIDESYKNLVRVPEKIIDMQFVAFSKKHDLRFNGWQSLRDYSIGYIRGWKIFEKNTDGFPHVQAVRNTEVLFSMLEKDRIEVALFARWIGMAILKERNMSGVYVVEPAIVTREMFIYLHRKHAALIPKISDSLKEMKHSGEYERLFKDKVINSVMQ